MGAFPLQPSTAVLQSVQIASHTCEHPHPLLQKSTTATRANLLAGAGCAAQTERYGHSLLSPQRTRPVAQSLLNRGTDGLYLAFLLQYIEVAVAPSRLLSRLEEPNLVAASELVRQSEDGLAKLSVAELHTDSRGGSLRLGFFKDAEFDSIGDFVDDVVKVSGIHL